MFILIVYPYTDIQKYSKIFKSDIQKIFKNVQNHIREYLYIFYIFLVYIFPTVQYIVDLKIVDLCICVR